MTIAPETALDTRQRLLQAAGEVFADYGFRDATVREICRRAGANVAAVNYHFGDKEGLYHEVLAYAGQQALEKYPIGGVVDPASSPADRLGAFVRNYLNRLLDEGRPAWHGKLMAREMVEPTRALDDLARHFVQPQYQRLRRIVADLLGPMPAPDQVRMCCASIVGQCLFYKLARPMIERVMPEQGYAPHDRAELARHITEFSLNAVRTLRPGSASSGNGSGSSP